MVKPKVHTIYHDTIIRLDNEGKEVTRHYTEQKNRVLHSNGGISFVDFASDLHMTFSAAVPFIVYDGKDEPL